MAHELHVWLLADRISTLTLFQGQLQFTYARDLRRQRMFNTLGLCNQSNVEGADTLDLNLGRIGPTKYHSVLCVFFLECPDFRKTHQLIKVRKFIHRRSLSHIAVFF